MKDKFKKLAGFVFNMIFPSQCVNCQKKINKLDSINSSVCLDCFNTIEITNCFYYPLCKKRLYKPEALCHKEAKFILAAATFYENQTIQNLIRALKYNNVKSTAESLTLILKKYIENVFLNRGGESLINFENYITIPIPLSPKKQRERGFNQITLVYKTLNQIMGEKLPLLQENILSRIKNTRSQTKCLNYDERVKNISGAFFVKNPEAVKNKNILLIDDIFTSGATLNEAVKTLKNAQAKKIISLVIARA
ncbi:MAG: phosphoribosyltransferase family protein [Patescibacteria group bacterium]|nr:phosphoribosyltransferase family protein [Patescibacteria group bacterium]